MTRINMSQLPVAVLGAGPIGLAATAHLLERGIEPLVFEAGSSPGTHLLEVQQVRLFTPWGCNIDTAARRLLQTTDWQAPDPEASPTAGELVCDYLEPLASHPAVRERLNLNCRVLAVTRLGHDKVRHGERNEAPFIVRVKRASGTVQHRLARAVIDATGTWSNPNPLGADGLPALGETEHRERIAYGLPDLLGREWDRYARRSVLVVGAGHSAAGTLLALAKLAEKAPGTRIHWAVRQRTPDRLFGTGEGDAIPARGALGRQVYELLMSNRITLHAPFPIREIRSHRGRLELLSANRSPPLTGVDWIIGCTGSRPDLELTRELRVHLDPSLESVASLAPLIDPNVHDCGSVQTHGHRELAQPERDFYIAGAKSYGRAPTFLMRTGYEQVRSIVAALAAEGQLAERLDPELTTGRACCGG